MAGDIERARAAFDRQEWAKARVFLGAAEPLDAADLQRLAVTAHLLGRSRDDVGRDVEMF